MAMSLLPFVVVDPTDALSRASGASAAHESWLRAHMTTTAPDAASSDAVDEAIERALRQARGASPATLEAFTRTFADAYQRVHRTHDVPVSLADLFAAPGVDSAALFKTLYARTQQFGRAAVLPRLHLTTAPTSGTSGRAAPAQALLAPTPVIDAVSSVGVVHLVATALGCWIHVLSSAQPLGP